MGRPPRAELLRASPPLFSSRWLDRFTRVHPFVPVAIFGPIVVLCALMALETLTAETLPVAIVSGYAFWTLCEYWTHRKLFHLEPKSDFGIRVHWIIHGVHHDHPNDPRRLVMPPIVSVPLAVVFRGVVRGSRWAAERVGGGRGVFCGLSAVRHASLLVAPREAAWACRPSPVRVAYASPFRGRGAWIRR